MYKYFETLEFKHCKYRIIKCGQNQCFLLLHDDVGFAQEYTLLYQGAMTCIMQQCKEIEYCPLVKFDDKLNIIEINDSENVGNKLQIKS